MPSRPRVAAGVAVCLALAWAASAATRDASSLVTAVRTGNHAALAALIKQGVNVNDVQGDGATPLQWAVHLDDRDAVEHLLRAGASPNAANAFGVTPLALACLIGSEVLVSRLLDAGADPNLAQTNGETPLMTCARSGAAAAVTVLLRKGATVDAIERWNGQTALMWASAQGHAVVAQALIEGGASVHAHSQATRVFVNTGGTTSGKTSEHLEFGGSTPLLFAARSGSLETARVLLDAGARLDDTSADGSSPLAIASLSGHGALAAFLLERGANPNSAGAGYTALHAAVLRADVPLLKTLLAHGADPNARLTKGMNMPRASQHYVFSTLVRGATPFFLAAKYAEPGLMRILASAGADTRAGLANGTTPLLAAAGSMWVYSGSEDRRERALAPDVLTAQRQDETPTFDAVRLAVELGGDVNATDGNGQTALHAAAALDFVRVVQFLVDRGARLDARNGKGQSALALAEGPSNDPRTGALLRALGLTE